MTEALIGYLEIVAAYAPTWGFALIFVFMTIESSFIPFPSEVVMIPAGFLAARGALSLGAPQADAALSIVAGVAGSLAGAYLNYFLSRWLGKPFLERYGKYFFLKPAALHRAEDLFLEYGAVTTFVCRLIPAIRQLISIPAGIARMPLASFTLFTGLGAGLWVTILTVVGFGFGRSTADMSYADLVHAGKALVKGNLVWILLGCAAIFVSYVLLHRRIMRRKQTSPPPS
ncbi:MAG: DedA family protein [Nannocystaceae bacterium]|nr:DedA family protein [Myxococcales bacterium]